MAGHWKKLMDEKEMLYAYDLDGRDVTITIEKVVGGELRGENNKKSKKPIVHIKGKTKKLALNVTNCKVIEQLTGTPDPAEWAGIRITIFPTTTDFGGKTVECIRVRPYHPKASSEKSNGKGDAKGKNLTEQIAGEMTKNGTPPGATHVGWDPSRDGSAERIEKEWNEKFEERKAFAERVLGRSLTDSGQITADEAVRLEEAFRAEDA